MRVKPFKCKRIGYAYFSRALELPIRWKSDTKTRTGFFNALFSEALYYLIDV